MTLLKDRSHSTGTWVWNLEHNTICRIIETRSVWGKTIYRIWLPDQGAIVSLRADQIKPLHDDYTKFGTHQINYIAAAGRVADALYHDLLLAPIESSVVPLPHQIRALSRAISNDRIRYLLVNQVGLGENIEPRFIMRDSGYTGYR